MWDKKFKITENGLTIEANYSKDSIKSKSFRFRIDDKYVDISREFLYQLLILFGKEEEQELLVDVKNVKVKTVRRELKIKAKKDIKEGEDIVVYIDFPVTEEVYDKVQTFKIK